MPFVAIADIKSFVHAFVPMHATHVCLDKSLPAAVRTPMERVLKTYPRIECIDAQPNKHRMYHFVIVDGSDKDVSRFVNRLEPQGIASVICGTINTPGFFELPWKSSLPVISYWKF
jgi:hypothetical protein